MTLVCLDKTRMKLLRILNTGNTTLKPFTLVDKIIKCTLPYVCCLKATQKENKNVGLLPGNFTFMVCTLD